MKLRFFYFTLFFSLSSYGASEQECARAQERFSQYRQSYWSDHSQVASCKDGGDHRSYSPAIEVTITPQQMKMKTISGTSPTKDPQQKTLQEELCRSLEELALLRLIQQEDTQMALTLFQVLLSTDEDNQMGAKSPELLEQVTGKNNFLINALSDIKSDPQNLSRWLEYDFSNCENDSKETFCMPLNSITDPQKKMLVAEEMKKLLTHLTPLKDLTLKEKQLGTTVEKNYLLSVVEDTFNALKRVSFSGSVNYIRNMSTVYFDQKGPLHPFILGVAKLMNQIVENGVSTPALTAELRAADNRLYLNQQAQNGQEQLAAFAEQQKAHGKENPSLQQLIETKTKELAQVASEENLWTLAQKYFPSAALDPQKDHEENLKLLRSRIDKCAREGTYPQGIQYSNKKLREQSNLKKIYGDSQNLLGCLHSPEFAARGMALKQLQEWRKGERREKFVLMSLAGKEAAETCGNYYLHPEEMQNCSAPYFSQAGEVVKTNGRIFASITPFDAQEIDALMERYQCISNPNASPCDLLLQEKAAISGQKLLKKERKKSFQKKRREARKINHVAKKDELERSGYQFGSLYAQGLAASSFLMAPLFSLNQDFNRATQYFRQMQSLQFQQIGLPISQQGFFPFLYQQNHYLSPWFQ